MLSGAAGVPRGPARWGCSGRRRRAAAGLTPPCRAAPGVRARAAGRRAAEERRGGEERQEVGLGASKPQVTAAQAQGQSSSNAETQCRPPGCQVFSHRSGHTAGTLRKDPSGRSDSPHPHASSSTPREAEAVPVTEARDSSFPHRPPPHTHPPAGRDQHLWNTVLIHLN